MIDFHCHILPGIDDGAKSQEESLELARQSVAAGITHIVATPHGPTANLHAHLSNRDRLLQELQALFDAGAIPLKLIPGMEYFADDHAESLAFSEPSLRCGDHNLEKRPMLMELPFNMDLTFVGNMLFRAQLKGLTLVLAHPERYNGFAKNIENLQTLMDKGLFLQFNGDNFRKALFFNSISKGMVKLMANNPDQVLIGSDAHSPGWRPAGFANAKEVITDALGASAWEKISETNPKKLLDI